jgi:RNA polymerase sigma factor (sigma-70 family)
VATGQLRDVVRRLGRPDLLADGGATDGQLLEGFVARRDEAAFEALVRRHGPMVLGVCRRILGSHHDAEDAFQATFLVLARKAASVRPRGLVGNFLYGVACNTARKALAAARRRREKEREAAAMPRPEAPDEVWRRLEPLLDQELPALPDRYRVPIVLCDLEGKTRKEAARQLGWAEGTVASRLARGRALLARRMGRHGLTLSGGAVAAAVGHGTASAALPGAPVAPLVKAAALFAAGRAGAAVGPAALAEGVLKAMLLARLKIAAALVLTLALVGVGAALFATHAPAQEAKKQPQDTGYLKPPVLDKLEKDLQDLTGQEKATGAPGDRAPEKAKEPAKEGGGPGSGGLPAILLRHVVLDAVNAQDRTISATVQGDPELRLRSGDLMAARLVGVPVAKDAQIVIDDKAGPLGALKPGAVVELQLAVHKDMLVVASIRAGGKRPPVGNPEEAQAKRKALLTQLQGAQAQVAVARANVDVALARLRAAEVGLKFSQGEKERAQAQAAVAVAQVEVKKSEADVAAAEAGVKTIEGELEKLGEKGGGGPQSDGGGPRP